MKAILFTLMAGTFTSAAHADEDATSRAARVDPIARCRNDAAVLRQYASAHKSGRASYKLMVSDVAKSFADQESVRSRLQHLASLAYHDPRFDHFADATYAANVQATCPDPVHRFDPFNWNGQIPPGMRASETPIYACNRPGHRVSPERVQLGRRIQNA